MPVNCTDTSKRVWTPAFAPLVLLLAAASARADAVADWAEKTTAIATEGPNTIRTLALAQGAVYEAVNAITLRYPADKVDLGPAQGASLEAAIAAASRAVLEHEAPLLDDKIKAAYEEALAHVPAGDTRTAGVSLGERAAADLLARHSGDIPPLEPYRPLTTPGAYVPTTFPLGVAVSQFRPWVLKSPSQLRPGPPPPLKSALWARDYNEVKTIGSNNSTVRTAEQTAIALFWATALPDVHMGVVHSYARAAGRDITRNARLYAAVSAALYDTEIAVFEAKYHYQFWRPLTAIRNGDRDDNAATERDPGWLPMIVTPIQPEYPCAHCMIASTIATILRIECAHEPMPTLSSRSNTAPGVVRSWTRTEDLVE